MEDVFLVAVPAVVVPPARPQRRHKTSHVLTGFDGEPWDLTDNANGLFLRTLDGIVGMEDPQWQILGSSSPLLPGARFHGAQAPAREVMLPLFISADSSPEFTEIYRRFKRLLKPDLQVMWRVQGSDSNEGRTLVIRYIGPAQDLVARDHRFDRYKRLNLRFIADERPFWEGDPIIREWGQPEEKPFIGPDGAPEFHISGSAQLASAVMPNPGDEPAWPVWEAHGPFTSVTVGVGEHKVTADLTLDEGESLRIDTRPGPRGKSAYDSHGVRRTGELIRRDFRPIPPGQEVPVNLSMVGTGSVKCILTPLYHEAI